MEYKVDDKELRADTFLSLWTSLAWEIMIREKTRGGIDKNDKYYSL